MKGNDGRVMTAADLQTFSRSSCLVIKLNFMELIVYTYAFGPPKIISQSSLLIRNIKDNCFLEPHLAFPYMGLIDENQ